MEPESAKPSPKGRSPSTSPTAGFSLQKRVLAWCHETGSPAAVCVRVHDKVYDLHKSALVSKSGYFKKALAESTDVDHLERFPGGPEIFEMVALFSYDHALRLDPYSVAALRCAAELLEMTEDCASGNLRDRTDLYLNQVVLQCWDDTLIVLQKCQALLPWSEELLIVSRCVESLAFMACMEILDPEQSRNKPVVTLQQALADGAWDYEAVKEIAGQDLWIKDLIALPFEFFKRIIESLKRQGMREKYVSPLVVFYANKWLLSEKNHQFREHTSDMNGEENVTNEVSEILQGVIELLPMRGKACRVIPVSFYFALLSRSLYLGLSNDRRMNLHDHVASLLHLAQVEDFLLPEIGCCEPIASTPELKTMEKIVKINMSHKTRTDCSGCSPLDASSIVAELWDRYLSPIAADPKLEPARFIELIEVIHMEDRETHDHLYRAMNTFLLEHPQLSTEERTSVCKYLNCQKLSQEVCIEVVQNEKLPLRLIVQALFVQQLNTHQAFKECSDSFRYMHHSEEFSGSIPSSRYLLPTSRNLGESPYKAESEVGETVGAPLSSLLQKELMRTDYEAASFRLVALEQELKSLKRNLQQQNTSKGLSHVSSKGHSFRLFGMEGRAVVKKRNPHGHGSSCIGSLSWASQRKYASRLVKVFGRITMLGKRKSKIKRATPVVFDGPLQHIAEEKPTQLKEEDLRLTCPTTVDLANS